MNTKKTVAAWLAALCLPLAAHAAYPDKPIRLIVPYAAGGGADGAARIVAQRLGAALGQQITIDNRAGAGGVLGADAAAKSAPDGYTVLFDASAFASNPALRKLPFDPKADLIPISLVVVAPNILVVPVASPYKTLAEFIEFGRQHPGKLTFASAGAGSASHLAGETLNDLAQLDMVHIPYKGGAPALNDLMGHQVSAYFGNTASTLGHVTAGKLRALAIGSTKRSATLPNVPTLTESKLPDFVSQEWNGVFVPKGTPADILQRLSKEIQAAVADPAVREKLLKLGLEPVGSTPAEFSAFVQAEMARSASIVKRRNIQVD